ncbi:MAG: hypothetical protein HXY18_20395 [Bryobacteraceae bacterium]|nr:hypothetical protein [Bryobacteraceae bacterium]
MDGRSDVLRLVGTMLLLVLAATRNNAAVPTSSQERLRQLTRLPQVSFSAGIAFTPQRGFHLVGEAADFRNQIEKLRQKLAEAPADPHRLVKLAELQKASGDVGGAYLASERATELFRQQGAEDSQDVELLVGYGDALQLQNKLSAAERVYRRAVQVAPRDWRGHAALARHLAVGALSALLPSHLEGADTPLNSALASELRAFPPGPRQVETSKRVLAEARSAVERAVELAPDQALPRQARASVAATERFSEAVLSGGDPAGEFDARRAEQAIFNPESVADLRAAARAANDPRAIGVATLCEVLAEALERGLRHAEEIVARDVWSNLTEHTRQAVRDAVARLQSLAQDAEPDRAAVALAILGEIQLHVLRDASGAETTLRRAVALDPANEYAWETLTLLLAQSQRYEPLREVCQARVRRNDTVRSRVLLAKALEKTRRFEEMLEVAERTQRRYRSNLLANLTYGAALLVAGADEAARARALQFIAKASQLAGEAPPPDVAVEILYQRGLYFALRGQPAVSRASLRQLLAIQPDHREAAEALKALDQAGD